MCFLVVVLLISNTIVSRFTSHSFFIYFLPDCSLQCRDATVNAVRQQSHIVTFIDVLNLNIYVQLFIAQNIQFMLHRRFLVIYFQLQNTLFITLHLFVTVFQTFTLIFKSFTGIILLKHSFETFLMSPFLYFYCRLQVLHQTVRMKQTEAQTDRESLYLEVSSVNGAVSLPLHSSIVLFLLSYTECSSFHVYLVTDQAEILPSLSGLVPGGLAVSEVRRDELPRLVKMCRLPAALVPDACFCRAGLAVVLRHIIQSACQLMPSRRDVASLLGFKNTCLKACAEVRLRFQYNQRTSA